MPKKITKGLLLILFWSAAAYFFVLIVVSGAGRLREEKFILATLIIMLVVDYLCGIAYRWIYRSETLKRFTYIFAGLFVLVFLLGDILTSSGFCPPRRASSPIRDTKQLFAKGGSGIVRHLLCPVVKATR